MILDNAEFIDGLRRQDPVAARHLNECFVPSVWRFVYARVDHDTHLAEDIVAESVLALVTAAASGTAIDHPAAWMRTVAVRRIQDHFRAAARVQHLIEQAQQQTQVIDELDPAAKHDQKLKRQNVREAMDDLPETYRLALEWKYVDQVSVKVIAKRLNATEKSAESVLYRARQALRNQLNKHGVEPSQSDAAKMPQNTDGSPVKGESANQTKQANGDSDSSLQKGRSPLFEPRLARES
ncbi:RNA polymerase sigma factor [Novipirellula sp. SH528]|uniref:RNA polymerase sigma factor n=1 Tax=Novipirellula sp. SH528 TaxID=3454466 RepID=UPI003FA0D998